MQLTDEIRNFQVNAALPAEIIKISREYSVLAILKYSFPEQFSCLRKAEAPDLQDKEGKLGIEVTSGLSQEDEMISGESVKYTNAKTEEQRQRCIKIIEKCGGTRDEFSTGYPVGTSERDKKNVIKIFTKKLKKIKDYREKCSCIGLAIILDIPLFFFSETDWGKWLTDINDNKFDFVVLVHWSGVDIYDFSTGKYHIKRISREDMDALKKLGRMAAEGLIDDDNPIWSC